MIEVFIFTWWKQYGFLKLVCAHVLQLSRILGERLKIISWRDASVRLLTNCLFETAFQLLMFCRYILWSRFSEHIHCVALVYKKPGNYDVSASAVERVSPDHAYWRGLQKIWGGGHSTYSKSCISSQAENDVIVAYSQTNLMDYSGGFEMLLQESGDTSFQAMPYNQVHFLNFSVYQFEEQVTKARH